ncbi:MAG: Dabb family protein [Oscillospiraceae bacterium]|nr:Dabb family protein [Oscillospiraceae bacterium]
MIKHIVMFRLKDAQGRTALENALEAKKRADRLPALVPSLRGFEAVVNSEAADPSNFHIALICTFDDMKGLEEYQVHPDHKAFGAFVAEIRAENGRACIDYEV